MCPIAGHTRRSTACEVLLSTRAKTGRSWRWDSGGAPARHPHDCGLGVGWPPHMSGRTALFSSSEGNKHSPVQAGGYPWGGEAGAERGWVEPVRSRGTGAPCLLNTPVVEICMYGSGGPRGGVMRVSHPL